MKSHRIFCLAASAALAGTAVAMAAPLTIDDYCDVKTAAPHSVKEMKPLADGQTYSCISDDEKSIDVYSYRTGKKVSTLFSVDNIAGSLKISEFDGYELSANEKKILLWNESEQIYRHTFRAEYYVYDVARRTLTRVSEAGAQQGAILSHDGRMVAYQRGNNIYIANLDYGTDVAVTTDGEINHIINGTPDWGYEEEFGVINT
ncbi:MAG: DPP IV N-terminal domain-containing protein, partial [Muribaculaceae bacterium]|nr:DPP IV N-terminal domain-containing protein [Muribaculaceae bacterium]